MRSLHPTGRDPPPPNIPLTRSWGPPPGVSRLGAPAFSSSGIPEDVQLALEAVNNLVTYCPDWAKRVDELSGQIQQRQLDLAKAFGPHTLDTSRGRPKSSKKSIKNKASIESLKPKDDVEAHPATKEPPSSAEMQGAQKPMRPSVSTDGVTQQDKQTSTANTSPTSSDQAKDHVIAAAAANARVALRGTENNKKRAATAESMFTGDGAATSKYRSKSMVIVYYDSYVQSFFEELVKFVSASRNLMRKAKMAAKVAQIKRMAELEMPDEDSGEDDEMELTAKFVPRALSPPVLRPEPDNNSTEANGTALAYEDSSDDDIVVKLNNKSGPLAVDTKPRDDNPADMLSTPHDANQLSYSRSNGATFNVGTPTRITSPLRSSVLFSSFGGPHHSSTDVFEDLDKALEVIQGMCEHAAHQFLREGECAEDITKINEKLTETKTTADGEMQKLLENDVDGALRKTLSEGPVRSRTYRSQSMRRDSSFAKVKATMNGGAAISEESINGSPRLTPGPAIPPVTLSPITLEVDEGIGNGSINSNETPKLQFRSTRAMGRQIPLGS